VGGTPRKGANADIQTRERLLHAALIEFSDKGYYLTNADAIAKRAGVGHGTFYLYFKSKNETLSELLSQIVARQPYSVYLQDFKYLMRQVHNRTELEAAILGILEPLEESAGLLKAYVQGMLQDEEVFAQAKEMAQYIARMFSAIIVAHQKKGRHKGYDARILSEIISICLTTSFLMAALEIVTCSSQALAHALSSIIGPLLFGGKSPKKTSTLRLTIPENDSKIRRDLLAAAKAEFIAHGYFEAKITHITRKAGYSRGTFYLYYKDKDDLLEAIFHDMMGTLTPRPNLTAGFIDTLDATSLENFVHILTEIVNIFDAPINWPLLQGFFNSPKLSRLYKDMFALYSQPIVNKIKALRTQGQCQGIDPDLAAPIILATVSYSAFLRNVQVITCTKRKYALNMAWFLYTFINQI
jgi:AcrR family transcriptional regulator